MSASKAQTVTFPGDLPITPEVVKQHKLTPEEYARIEEHLGRVPTYTELGVFSVMWSEHCSYKSSRVHLRRLPTKGPRVIHGPAGHPGAGRERRGRGHRGRVRGRLQDGVAQPPELHRAVPGRRHRRRRHP